MQNQVPLVSVPIAGAVPAAAITQPGVQPSVPPDPTASMQMAAVPIQQQPGSPQALAQPAAPAMPNGMPNGQVVFPNGMPQMMVTPQQNGVTQQTAQFPGFYQQVPQQQVPQQAAPAAPPPATPQAGQPIPITAENLAALGYVPASAPQQPAAPAQPPVAPTQPAPAPAQPPAAPSQPAGQQPAATPPNGQPATNANGQPAVPALDIVRSDKPEVQALLNKQRDQIVQAYEAAQARSQMEETERLRAEKQDAINLANQHAVAATQARQSYELASALMNSGQQLQPNAQAIVEAQVAPLLQQGVPAQQALAHVLQSHPYLLQAQPAQGQQGAADTQILGISDGQAGSQPQGGFPPQQPLQPQAGQMLQAPVFGQPVQAVFQQPTTGFLGQPMTAMGGQHPVFPGQQQEVDLRSVSPKEFRDWKLANGIQS